MSFPGPTNGFLNHSSGQSKEIRTFAAAAATSSCGYVCKHPLVLEKCLVYIMKSTPLIKHFLNTSPCTDMLLQALSFPHFNYFLLRSFAGMKHIGELRAWGSQLHPLGVFKQRVSVAAVCSSRHSPSPLQCYSSFCILFFSHCTSSPEINWSWQRPKALSERQAPSWAAVWERGRKSWTASSEINNWRGFSNDLTAGRTLSSLHACF